MRKEREDISNGGKKKVLRGGGGGVFSSNIEDPVWGKGHANLTLGGGFPGGGEEKHLAAYRCVKRGIFPFFS